MTRGHKRAAYQRAYKAAHVAERATYNAANREAILAYSHARYALKGAADNARQRLRKRENPDKTRAQNRAKYYSVPPEIRQARTKAFNAKYAENRRAWREKHKERIAKRAAKWTRENLGLKRAATSRRLAAKLRATPAWADLIAIQAIYIEASRLTRETGIAHEVDHIVPLRSPLVCGLHTAGNLQILTKTENRRKWNRLTAA